jgi:hypothetical protein
MATFHYILLVSVFVQGLYQICGQDASNAYILQQIFHYNYSNSESCDLASFKKACAPLVRRSAAVN